MIINILLMFIGFITLIKGADFFVEGAKKVAVSLGVNKMLVGLTIVAFGTSLPEFAVSIQAINDSKDIVLGNVIGSNIINILLILGITALINNIKITRSKELTIGIIITSLFGLFILNNTFTRIESLALLIIFIIFLYKLIKSSKEELEKTENLSIIKALSFTIIGLIGVIIGSNTVVDSAVNISKILGVSERIIALTIIALGTSLPELTTSIIASKKGEDDILVGNILGSNIFNIGMVVSIPVLIFGKINFTINNIDILVMIIAIISLFIFSKDRKISKKEGLILIIIFIIYYSYILS